MVSGMSIEFTQKGTLTQVSNSALLYRGLITLSCGLATLTDLWVACSRLPRWP